MLFFIFQVTFVTCIGFFIAWTPYTIFSFSSYFKHKPYTLPQYSILPGFAAKLSWLYNPLIYFFMVVRFRQSAIDMILCRADLNNLRGRSNILTLRQTRLTTQRNTTIARETREPLLRYERVPSAASSSGVHNVRVSNAGTQTRKVLLSVSTTGTNCEVSPIILEKTPTFFRNTDSNETTRETAKLLPTAKSCPADLREIS